MHMNSILCLLLLLMIHSTLNSATIPTYNILNEQEDDPFYQNQYPTENCDYVQYNPSNTKWLAISQEIGQLSQSYNSLFSPEKGDSYYNPLFNVNSIWNLTSFLLMCIFICYIFMWRILKVKLFHYKSQYNNDYSFFRLYFSHILVLAGSILCIVGVSLSLTLEAYSLYNYNYFFAKYWCEQREIIYMFKNTYANLDEFNGNILKKYQFFENLSTIDTSQIDFIMYNTQLQNIMYGEYNIDQAVEQDTIDKFRVLFPKLNIIIDQVKSNVSKHPDVISKVYDPSNKISSIEDVIILDQITKERNLFYASIKDSSDSSAEFDSEIQNVRNKTPFSTKLLHRYKRRFVMASVVMGALVVCILLTYLAYYKKYPRMMYNMRYASLLIMIFMCKTLHTTITQQNSNVDLCSEFNAIDREMVLPPVDVGLRNYFKCPDVNFVVHSPERNSNFNKLFFDLQTNFILLTNEYIVQVNPINTKLSLNISFPANPTIYDAINSFKVLQTNNTRILADSTLQNNYNKSIYIYYRLRFMQKLFDGLNGILYCDSIRELSHAGTDIICNDVMKNIANNQTLEIVSIFLGLVILFFGQIRAYGFVKWEMGDGIPTVNYKQSGYSAQIDLDNALQSKVITLRDIDAIK